MQHTTNIDPPATLTLTARHQSRWTPGLHPFYRIVFPCVGSAAAPDADHLTVSDLGHLVTLFLATADRMGDLAARIARMERQARAGKISPRTAARHLRRILAAVEVSMETLDQTPL